MTRDRGIRADRQGVGVCDLTLSVLKAQRRASDFSARGPLAGATIKQNPLELKNAYSLSPVASYTGQRGENYASLPPLAASRRL